MTFQIKEVDADEYNIQGSPTLLPRPTTQAYRRHRRKRSSGSERQVLRAHTAQEVCWNLHFMHVQLVVVFGNIFNSFCYSALLGF